jgi:hypothetical protein
LVALVVVAAVDVSCSELQEEGSAINALLSKVFGMIRQVTKSSMLRNFFAQSQDAGAEEVERLLEALEADEKAAAALEAAADSDVEDENESNSDEEYEPGSDSDSEDEKMPGAALPLCYCPDMLF